MNRYRIALVLPLLVLLAACGPKPERSESVLDNPEYHVSQGLKHLQQGTLDQAEAEFARANELDPKYAHAWAGIALVRAQQGQIDEAEDLADEAVDKAKKDPFVWAARGRVYSLITEPGDYDGDIDDQFEKAVDLDADFDLAWYWWGLAKKRAWDFDDAGAKFARAIALRGEWIAEADAAYAEVQDILRAAPASRIGVKIAQVDTLDRADLSVLFLEELKLAEVMERTMGVTVDPKYVPPKDANLLPPEMEGKDMSLVPQDVRGHWAETWILQVIDLGVMEIAPDRRFYPDQPVTRGEFALFLQNIMANVLHDETLPTKYIGEPTRFKDMRSGTATYNAAALAVDRGFMDADIMGRFQPDGYVTGAEALLSIRAFQDHLEYEF
ncbi:S-layer homology domain-containing protein [bacterium]|nr:S-layer homology domain-containing protein [bacterium]